MRIGNGTGPSSLGSRHACLFCNFSFDSILAARAQRACRLSYSRSKGKTSLPASSSFRRLSSLCSHGSVQCQPLNKLSDEEKFNKEPDSSFHTRESFLKVRVRPCLMHSAIIRCWKVHHDITPTPTADYRLLLSVMKMAMVLRERQRY